MQHEKVLEVLYRDRRAADVLRAIAASVLLTESALNEIAAASGVQRVDVRLLGWLWIRGPLQLSELGRLTDMSKPGMTAASKRLREAGLITLEHDRGDRRKVMARLGPVLPEPLLERMHHVAAVLFDRLGGQPVDHARAVTAFFEAAAEALEANEHTPPDAAAEMAHSRGR